MFIKVKVNRKGEQKNYIVDFVPQWHPSIGHVVNRIIDVCGLDKVAVKDIEMKQQAFTLPHGLTSTYLNEKTIYELNLMSSGSKKEKKRAKLQEKMRRQVSSDSQSQRECQSQRQPRSAEQQSSSSSLSPIKPIQKHRQKINNKIPPKINSPQLGQHIKSVRNKSVNNQVSTTKNNHLKHKNIRQKGFSQQQESSDSDSSLPVIPKKNKAKVHTKITLKDKPQLRKKDSIKSSSHGELSSSQTPINKPNIVSKPIQAKQPLEKKIKNDIPVVKKVVVKDSSSQSSQEQSSQKQKPQKSVKNTGRPIPISVRKQNFEKPKQTDERSRFQLHQQSQWIAITKQILEKWEKQNDGKCILLEGNEIRFKIMDLDEQKFIPVLSGWISGTVAQTNKQLNSTNIKLCNCIRNNPQGKSQYLKNYDIPLINIQELQIKRITIKQIQKSIIDSPQSQSTQPKTVIEENKSKEEEKANQSLQGFICGQINYYFSDKNYPTDLFMKMHADRDPKKYIPVAFMLNFPKIKKVLTDQHKLWSYLSTDERYRTRNYQLDMDRKMIRKKNSHNEKVDRQVNDSQNGKE